MGFFLQRIVAKKGRLFDIFHLNRTCSLLAIKQRIPRKEIVTYSYCLISLLEPTFRTFLFSFLANLFLNGFVYVMGMAKNEISSLM